MSRNSRCISSAFRLLYSLLRSGQYAFFLHIRMISFLCVLAMRLAIFCGVFPLFWHVPMLHCHFVSSLLSGVFIIISPNCSQSDVSGTSAFAVLVCCDVCVFAVEVLLLVFALVLFLAWVLVRG